MLLCEGLSSHMTTSLSSTLRHHPQRAHRDEWICPLEHKAKPGTCHVLQVDLTPLKLTARLLPNRIESASVSLGDLPLRLLVDKPSHHVRFSLLLQMQPQPSMMLSQP